MDDREFAEALREIENLPDTAGGGIGSARQERSERIDFAYKRRDMFESLLCKAELSLKDVRDEIKRLVEEERVELAQGASPLPQPRRRATDMIVGER